MIHPVETANTIPSSLDGFARDVVATARLALVGSTGALRARIQATGTGRLLVGQLLLATILGLQTLDPRKMVGYPVLIGALSLVWTLLYALVTDLERPRVPAILSSVLGTSYVLWPAAVPLVGPWLLQTLILAWPFVLARVLAAELERKPGPVLRDLILPPFILWLTLQAMLWIVGRAFFDMEISV